MSWSINDIPDLNNKTVILTGANSGIGFEASKVLASKGATLIWACRNLSKAKVALKAVKESVANAKVSLMQLDLSQQASVHSFAKEFKAKHKHLDILINNAGILGTDYQTTEDGFELLFATNHLGHFTLTGLLLSHLEKSPSGRIITLSSSAHKTASMNFDNLMFEGGKGYSGFSAYGQSKLANLLFTFELQRRLLANNSKLLALAVHPGMSGTDIFSVMDDKWYYPLIKPIIYTMAQSPKMGALPTLMAVSDATAQSGDYYGPSGFQELRGSPKKVRASSKARDIEAAKTLWEKSEVLTGVSYLNPQ